MHIDPFYKYRRGKCDKTDNIQMQYCEPYNIVETKSPHNYGNYDECHVSQHTTRTYKLIIVHNYYVFDCVCVLLMCMHGKLK